ncbi:hypothetical protein TSUD_275770 [Trifolium subterraneum]|uniref:DUF223 domain-containing protein n=1 Tax=Trifolium subterraneum TaxID=3900 RepID=A0A2Z6MBQ1_TRISU|nr:hypothetical protein TSUD_275770 [Trifolium subterraneum]
MSLMKKFTPVSKLHSLRLDWSIMGKMIQATVPTPCVNRFIDILFEDGVYIIEFFSVKENVSSCMYTLSRFKLDFCMDVIGVITDVFCQVPYENTGVMEISVRVRLADTRGCCDCILLGDCANQLEGMLNGCTSDVPILVLQFVKIVARKGDVCVQSVENVTRVLLNPHFIEVDQFKIDMGYFTNSIPLVKKEYYSSSKSCKELEFNGFYPHKTVYELIHTLEDGVFVLCGKIVGLFKVDQWFYHVCHCGAFLNIGFGSYYCVYCHLSVFSAAAKCKFQIGIQDGTSGALLPMSESLLQGIESVNNNGACFALSSSGEKILADKVILMIVKKTVRPDELSDDIVDVLRVTDDIDMINQFHFHGTNFTPLKSMFQGSSAQLTPVFGNIGVESSMVRCVGRGKNLLIEDGFNLMLNDGPPSSHKKSNDFKVPNDNVVLIGGISSEGSTSSISRRV